MWGSVIIAVVLVGLVMLLFVLLNHSIRQRQQLHSDLTRLELTHEGIQAAIRHFRHDMANLLGTLNVANDVVRSNLDREMNQPANLSRALEVLDANVRQGVQFVRQFRPCEQETQSPLDLEMLVRQLGDTLVFGEEELQLELHSWVVRTCPIAMTILVGNLLRNALDAGERMVVRRVGQQLRVENPVSEEDARFLDQQDIYQLGVSTKGEGHGIGLESAMQAARQCNVALSHEVFEGEDGPWARFTVDFSTSPPILVRPTPDRARKDTAAPVGAS